MSLGIHRAFLVFLLLLEVVAGGTPLRAQIAGSRDKLELTARARVFPEVGPDVRALKRDSTGRYLVLAAPNNSILIFTANGKRAGQLLDSSTKPGAITLADDFDLDSSGRVVVADRGANAVKIFSPEGKLALAIPFPSPTSVVALPSGEIVAASPLSKLLINVFDSTGKWLRDFGNLSDSAERAELNRYLNIGRLASDEANHVYYAFTYLPEATVRKYDRFGFGAWEITLSTLDLEPAARAQRREIGQQEEKSSAPTLRSIISAIGVDRETQEVWLALGNELLYFDKDGTHRGSYRTYTPEGARLEPSFILVERDRLLLASNPVGIFEFDKPKKPDGATTVY